MTTHAPPRFVLPHDLIADLGSTTTAVPTALSPLTTAPLTDTIRQRLMQCGVLDTTGQVTPEFDPILRTLTSATGVAQVQLTGGSSLIDVRTYSADDATVSAITSPHGLEVTSPAETGEAIRTLTEHLGFSLLSSLTIAVQLPLDEALVFGALVDCHRRRQLEALLTGSPSTSIDPTAVRARLTDAEQHPQWLVPVLAMAAGVVPTTVAARVDAVLGGISRDVLHAAEQLATRFSIIDKVLTMTSATFGADGEPVVSQICCLQAGVHDLLVIEPGTDSVGFVTLPSSMILSRIAAILADPSGELSAASPDSATDDVQRPVATPGERFCPSCGTEHRSTGQFCTGCGHRRSIAS